MPSAQPQSFRDIDLQLPVRGRPFILQIKHAQLISKSVKYFADNNTPLTRPGVREFVRTYVETLPETEREHINLGDHGPSDVCLNNMMKRFGLQYQSVQIVEDQRLLAITPATVSELIARIRVALGRYGIRDPRFIFNTDQSGSSFNIMCGRSLRKGYGKKDKKLQQACIRTKGQPDRVTVMPCISASGKAYKPVLVFPGVQPHYRKVRRQYQDMSSVLLECYLHYRETPGADSAIVYDWAKNFLDETRELRKRGQYLMTILDGYSAHIQFNALNLFHQNRVIVVALPALSSHRLQPLDVSVFAAYKSYLEAETHRSSSVRSILSAFDIGSIISYAYGKCMTISNMRNGFMRCGIWDPETLSTNVDHLKHLFVSENTATNGLPTADDLVTAYLKKGRSLLRKANVEESGTIRISTTKGAHLTSEVVLSALRERNERRQKSSKSSKTTASEKDVKESAAARLRYAELADVRHEQRKGLRQTRNERHVRQKRLIQSSKICQMI